MKQTTRFLYRVYRGAIGDEKPRHTLEAFGQAVRCRSKKEALQLERKLNSILSKHDSLKRKQP